MRCKVSMISVSAASIMDCSANYMHLQALNVIILRRLSMIQCKPSRTGQFVLKFEHFSCYSCFYGNAITQLLQPFIQGKIKAPWIHIFNIWIIRELEITTHSKVQYYQSVYDSPSHTHWSNSHSVNSQVRHHQHLPTFLKILSITLDSRHHIEIT
jgi:hypothetical protein